VRVAGLDVGGSTVKAWVADGDGRAVRAASAPLPVQRPAPHRVELDPAALEDTCRTLLARVVDPQPIDAVTVCSMRQAFLLLDAADAPLGPIVLNSDRRGAPHMPVLAGRHALTGHWPAPELTLPKLLAVQHDEPDRWAATRRVLFVHDWLLWRLTGEQVTEASYACAGGMADVAGRTWAHALLDECGIRADRLAPVVEAGTHVGRVVQGWPVAAGTPVVAGCGDTQLAALAVGGLADGVVTVVAGSSTPVLATAASPVRDPLARPWISTHAAPDRWAVEGNAGYPGTASGWWDRVAGPGPDITATPSPVVAVTAAPLWSEGTWARKPPTSLVGLSPDTTTDHIRAALLQAHAYAVRGNVEDLERVLARRPAAVVVTGGAADDGALPRLLAAVLGRPVHWQRGVPAGGAVLASRALGEAREPSLPDVVVPPGDAGLWEQPYQRWVHVTEALRNALPE
jgi:sugar (pentulose or hexulose) kinase